MPEIVSDAKQMYETPLEARNQIYLNQTDPGYAANIFGTVQANSQRFVGLSGAAERGAIAGADPFDVAARQLTAQGGDPEEQFVTQQPQIQSWTMQPEEYNQNYAPRDVNGDIIPIGDKPMPAALAQIIGRQKTEQLQTEGVRSRFAATHSGLTTFAVGAIASQFDPTMLALNFVPPLGEAALLARLGTGLLARTTARIGAGAATGGLIAAPQAGLAALAAMNPEERSDYGMRDALRDVFYGAAGFAALHAGFGAAGDVWKALRPVDPLQVPLLPGLGGSDAATQNAVMRSGIGQFIQGRPFDISLDDRLRASTATGLAMERPGRVEIVAAPDVEAQARRIAPEVFARYDPLVQRLTELRTRIQDPEGTFGADIDRQIAALRVRAEAARGDVPPVGLSAEELRARVEQQTAAYEAATKAADALGAQRAGLIHAQLVAARLEHAGVDAQLRDIAGTGEVARAKAQAENIVGARAAGETTAMGPAGTTPGEIAAAAAERGLPPAVRPLEGGSIASDYAGRLVAAGRPGEEAAAHAGLLQSFYESMATTFRGALGTAEDLYRGDYPDVVRGLGGELAQGELGQSQVPGTSGEAKYEWAADRMRDWTVRLNRQNWQGRSDWTPAEVQAVGWMTMSKMLGRAGQTAEEAISANIRSLSYELDFGAGAPWNQIFPEFAQLPLDDKARISTRILDRIMNFAVELTGANEFVRIAGTGGWEEAINPAFRSRFIASPEVTADVANIAGYLGQQTAVFESRWVNNPSAKIGLAIHGEGLDSDTAVRALWAEIVAKHPDLAVGFSPTRDPAGKPGIEMTFAGGGARLAERIKKELLPTVDAVGKRLGIDTETQFFRAESRLHTNDWERYPDGREYTQRLGERYGPEIQGRLDDFNRGELEPALREEIAAATGKSAAAEPGAAAAEPGAQGAPGELEQAGRAKIRPATDLARALITLFQTADATSFIHEFFHHAAQTFFRLSDHPMAPADFRADAAVLRRNLGMKEGETVLNTAQQEQLAQWGEQYAMSGKAPKPELNNVFAKMRAWMLKIYQDISALGVPINDEVRGVFDRWFAAAEGGETPGTFRTDINLGGRTRTIEGPTAARASPSDVIDRVVRQLRDEQRGGWAPGLSSQELAAANDAVYGARPAGAAEAAAVPRRPGAAVEPPPEMEALEQQIQRLPPEALHPDDRAILDRADEAVAKATTLRSAYEAAANCLVGLAA